MSPVKYTEFSPSGHKYLRIGLQISTTTSTGTIPEGDSKYFILGLGSRKRVVNVVGSGGILIRHLPSQEEISQLHVTEKNSPFIIEDTDTGQKLELLFVPPEHR
jgi:hypothetical protein